MNFLRFWKSFPLWFTVALSSWFLFIEVFLIYFGYDSLVASNIREAKNYVAEFSNNTLFGSRWLQSEIDSAVSQAHTMGYVLIACICFVFLIFAVVLTLIVSFLFKPSGVNSINAKIVRTVQFLLVFVGGSIGEFFGIFFVYGSLTDIGDYQHYAYQYVGQSINNHRVSRSEVDAQVFGTYLAGFAQALIVTVVYIFLLAAIFWLFNVALEVIKYWRTKKLASANI